MSGARAQIDRPCSALESPAAIWCRGQGVLRRSGVGDAGERVSRGPRPCRRQRVNAAVAPVTALASALTYATAGVLQHRVARGAPTRSGRPLDLLAYLVTRPVWVAGILLDTAGVVLHGIALWAGQLAVVQPVLVSGLLFALPASVLLERRRPSLTEWSWAFVLVTGLAVFLVVSNPTADRFPPTTDRLRLLTLLGTALAAVFVLLAIRSAPTGRAALLGVAGGVANAMTAALLKQLIHTGIGPDALSLATSWVPYLLLLNGIASLAITQQAFQSGPLVASLPNLTMVPPVLSVVFGVLAFGETLRHSPAQTAAEVAAFVAMTVAAVQLARRQGTRSSGG